MKKSTKRLIVNQQIIRDLSEGYLREVRGGDSEPCGTSIARGRCVVTLGLPLPTA